MSSSPEELLDRALLRQLAGEQGFANGEEYFADGRVRHLHVGTDRVTARVNGSRAYRVKLWRARGELQHSCSCPVGQDDLFCKHCVAVGLAWLAGTQAAAGEPGGTAAEAMEGRGNRSAEADRAREKLHEHLRTLDHDRLVQLVLESTDFDDILRRRLLLETAGVIRPQTSKRSAPRLTQPDLEAYSRLLREAIETPDYVDYESMPDYAQGVEEAIRPLGTLLRDGYASAVVELAEFALIELEKAGEMIDGGDGSLNAVYDDLQRYHLEACRAARPDPAELAARLLQYEIEGGLGVFNNAARAYADVLGPKGLEVWRQLLVREWTSLPDLKATAADKPPPTAGQLIDYRRFHVQALMERLAEAEGDTKALIGIRERDLSSAHDYLALAELYDLAKRPEDAADCAERGMRAFKNGADAAGLRDFLITAYESTGRQADAVSLLWEAFIHYGDAEHYRQLKRHVQRTGTAAEWTGWRARAFAHLREKAAAETQTAKRQSRTYPPGSSPLVEILIDERRYDDAWHEAIVGGCRTDLWLQLAAKREKKHPADALKVYQSRLEPTITFGGQTAYREAIDLLDKIRALLDRLGRGEDFAPYRAEIRAAHRQKRNFLKLLDASGR